MSKDLPSLDLPSNQDESLISLNSDNKLKIISAITGLLLIGFGVFFFFKPFWQGPEIQVLEASTSAGQTNSVGKITAEISGSVVKPGVYELLANERVERLLILAGGFSQNADRGWIAKNLNQAAKVMDGQKIYIPKQGEVEISSTSRASSTGSSGVLGAQNQLININTATLAELDTLPGIGATRAQAIVSNRPYSSIQELVSKKVIPKSVYEKIKDRVIAP